VTLEERLAARGLRLTTRGARLVRTWRAGVRALDGDVSATVLAALVPAAFLCALLMLGAHAG